MNLNKKIINFKFMEEIDLVRLKFFNEIKEIKMKADKEGIRLNLIPLLFNKNKNKGTGTIIQKQKENTKYNEQDYPLILKYPGVMKIEQIYTKVIDSNLYFLLIMEESLSNFHILNKSLHEDSGYLILKIDNRPFNRLVGENLLKYFIRQLIILLEFIDRNNFCFKELSLDKFFVTKKDFLLRLYNFKDILNLADLEKPIEKKSNKKSSSKKKDNSEEIELIRKKHYFQICKSIIELYFGHNPFIRKENESSEFYEEKIKYLSLVYKKKIESENIDENLKRLLIGLLEIEPKCRSNIEEIYRNKWLYDQYEVINDIVANFEKDIVKIISEFAKNDYFKRLEKCYSNNKIIKKNKNNAVNNKVNNIDNNIIIENNKNKKSKTIKTGRFTFKKKNKKI